MNISSTSSFHRPDPAEFFKRADTDGNGSISKDELKTMFENGPQPPPPPPDGDASAVSSTTSVDAASSTDASSRLDKMFASMDADSDGQISQSELQAAMQKMQEKHGHHGHHTSGFSGSSDAFSSILDTLKKQDDGDTTSELSGDQRKLIEQVLTELKNNGTYGADGSSGSSASTPSLFGTTA